METRRMRMYRSKRPSFRRRARRRWNRSTTIPWEKLNRDASDDLVICAETVCGVAMYLRTTWPADISVRNRSARRGFRRNGHRGVETRSRSPIPAAQRRARREIVDFRKDLRQGWERPSRAQADATLLWRHPGDGHLGHLIEAAATERHQSARRSTGSTIYRTRTRSRIVASTRRW